MLLCVDRLNIAWTRGSFISFSSEASEIKAIGWSESYSCGCFKSSIDSEDSISVSDFSKFLWFVILSVTKCISSVMRIFGISFYGM